MFFGQTVFENHLDFGRIGKMAGLLLWLTLATLNPGETPTWSKEVAPIVYKHCVGCHRTGSVGPFDFISYKDVSRRAKFLGELVANNRMPPWKPELGHGAFKDEMRLSEKEKGTIAAWVAGGAPEGDPKDLPPEPTYAKGWKLGTPDKVITMPKPFDVPAEGKDIYQCFVIPLNLTQDESVIAVEFQPGNAKVVHHAILFLDHNQNGRRKMDPKTQSYQSFGGPGIVPTGGLGAWAPGARPMMLPEGTGRYLKKESDLVLQIHYHPSGKPETDQSRLAIYYAKTPTKQYVGAVALRSRTLVIPAGESQHAVEVKTIPLPVDVTAIGIFPHMHLIGKEIKVDAQLPDGKEIPLIWIRDWDFNWQGSYSYKEPIDLPAGTVLKMKAIYNNSVSNPRNPSHPPKVVTWGEETNDEMCLCGVQVITKTKEEMKKIIRMPSGMIGMILGGGGVPETAEEIADAKKNRTKIIVQTLLSEYDQNGDGLLSKEELTQLPKESRDRAMLFLRIMGKLKD